MRGRSRRYVSGAAVLLLGLVVNAAPAGAGTTVCTLSVNDVTLAEGDAGTTNFVFTVTQSGTPAPAIVEYATADGTATATDYDDQSGTVTLGAATPSDTVTVPVFGDTNIELDETFFLNISDDGGPCTFDDNQGTGTITNDDVELTPPPPDIPTGYRLTALDGGVFAYGESTYEGSASQLPSLNAPIIDIDETPDRSGYWQVGLDGGVFAWNAPFFGSAGSLPLNAPVLGIAARPQGDGYWLVGLDGGVFAYGDAPYLGSKASTSEQEGLVILDIQSTSTGMGYWLLDAYGQVFAFGDAVDFGDHQAGDVEAIGLAPTPDSLGYWIANWAAQVFEFGAAEHQGDIAEPESLNGSIAAIEPTAAGEGYWLVGIDGGVFAFGDADFYGSAASLPLQASVVAIAGQV